MRTNNKNVVYIIIYIQCLNVAKPVDPDSAMEHRGNALSVNVYLALTSYIIFTNFQVFLFLFLSKKELISLLYTFLKIILQLFLIIN